MKPHAERCRDENTRDVMTSRKPLSEWPSCEFICVACCDQARINPDDPHEWGCSRCRTATPGEGGGV